MSKGHCKAHSRAQDKARGTRQERGYDRDWERVRDAYRSAQPYCVGYPKGVHGKGSLVLLDVVDHIISIRQRPDLRLEMSNLQGLCTDCHAAKTTDEKRGVAALEPAGATIARTFVIG